MVSPISLTILLLLWLVLRRSFIIVTVNGQSMKPTLLGGDRVLLLRFWPRRWLRQGQIIVCEYLTKSKLNTLHSSESTIFQLVTRKYKSYFEKYELQDFYIKRLLGTGGDQVVIPTQDAPDWLLHNRTVKRDSRGNFVWQVPPGHCFVKGDSPYSYDSTSLGPIPLDHIVGIVLLKLPRRAESIDPAGSSPPASIELPEKQ